VPTYTFRCASCGDVDHRCPMSEIPTALDCPTCGGPARRRWTSVAATHGDSPARRTIERAERSASQPRTVAAPPPARSSRPVSRNPLHATLPRP